MTADIVRFPRQPVASPGTDGRQRLQLALQALEEALAGQRAAIADWRNALATLGTVMSGLGDSVQRYRGSLDSLGERVAALDGQARQLEQTADAVMVRRSPR